MFHSDGKSLPRGDEYKLFISKLVDFQIKIVECCFWLKKLEKFKNSVKSKDGTDHVKGRDERCSWYVACKDLVAWGASSVHEQVTIAGMANIV